MRPIDADALMELARNNVRRVVDCNDIARFPTIDVAPVVHARWEGLEGLNCSVCGESYMEFAEGCSYPVYRENRLCTPPYCPHCGAKMDK